MKDRNVFDDDENGLWKVTATVWRDDTRHLSVRDYYTCKKDDYARKYKKKTNRTYANKHEGKRKDTELSESQNRLIFSGKWRVESD